MRVDRRWMVVAVLAVLVGLFFAFDIGQYLNLDTIKAQPGRARGLAGGAARAWPRGDLLRRLRRRHRAVAARRGGHDPGRRRDVRAVAGACCWFPSPPAIGATLAFLASRFLLRDCGAGTLRRHSCVPINAGIERDGAFYLFTLRLVPVFPFFVINLVMGLTPIRTLDLLLGQPARHAGRHRRLRERRHAARRRSRSLSRHPLAGAARLSFVLLGIFPLIAKKLVACVQARKVYARLEAAARFDRNLVVIGAGSPGWSPPTSPPR